VPGLSFIFDMLCLYVCGELVVVPVITGVQSELSHECDHSLGHVQRGRNSAGAIRTPINTAAWQTKEAYAELMRLVPSGCS
jgi:hypothetical protein